MNIRTLSFAAALLVGSTFGAGCSNDGRAPALSSSSSESLMLRGETRATHFHSERYLIWRASIELEVKDVAEAAARIEEVTAGVDGRVASTSVGDGNRGRMHLEVPQDRIDEVLEAIGELGKVRDLSKSSEDVTAA